MGEETLGADDQKGWNVLCRGGSAGRGLQGIQDKVGVGGDLHGCEENLGVVVDMPALLLGSW